MSGRRALALAGALAAAAGPLAAGPVYDEVYAGLSAHANRLPGTPAYEASLATLERALRGAGLVPHRQTFQTVVPRTRACSLEVGGRPVGPVFPLAPNGLCPTTTGGEAIEGPLVWLGEGTLEEMEGRPVEGAIALLRLGSRRVGQVFAQGARAVVMVGDEAASQWDVATQFTELPVARPQFYLPREAAAAAGLVGATNAPAASIRSTVTWEDAVAANLWAEIPGEPGAKFYLGREEVLVLAAGFDTFGVVPDLCPDPRRAANAALLAEVAAELARGRPKRSVIVVFLGAHYAAQEGARHFYYAVDKAEKGGWNTDPLDLRAGRYAGERALVAAQLELLGRPDLLTAEHPQRFAVYQLLRRQLDARVNNLNFDLRDLLLREQAAARRGAAPDPALAAAVARAQDEKQRWNRMRRELRDRRVEHAGDFAEMVAALRADLGRRCAEIDAMAAHNEAAAALAARFSGRSVVGHFGLDFADARRGWYLNMLADYRICQPDTLFTGPYLANLAALRDVHARCGWPAGAAPLVEAATRCAYPPYSLSLPAEPSQAAAMTMPLGVPGYELMTAGDALPRDGLPSGPSVDLAPLARPLAAFFAAAADAPALSQRPVLKRIKLERLYTYLHLGGDTYYGDQFLDYAKGSGEPAGPARHALALSDTLQGLPALAGHTRMGVARVNGAGYFFLPLAREGLGRRVAFGFDDAGRVVRFPYQLARSHAEAGRLFHGYGGGFQAPYRPRLHGAFGRTATRVLNARNDSAEKYTYLAENPGETVFYLGRDVPVKYAGANGDLVLGTGPAHPLGLGVPATTAGLAALDTVRLSARDYARLNQDRLQALRARHIVNDSVEALHAAALEHLEEADAARATGAVRRAVAHEVGALTLGLRAYDPLRGVTSDLVRAVVYLMILSIPFAFAMERLVFGFTSIYRQVAGFAGFFVATFGTLYVVHPAFALASAPLVIFLAFVIILMSSVVIGLVMSKFRRELRAIQGLASKVHGTASDSSTAGAAVLIGISGLRKRPVKTFLTAATVVLLTFTILVFASFTSRLDVVETYLGRGQGPDRIEVHRFSLLPMPPAFAGAVATLYGDAFECLGRSALFADPASPLRDREPALVLYNPANGRAARIGAVLGLDPRECARRPDLAAIAPLPAAGPGPGDAPPLRLPASVAGPLGLREGDPVSLLGRSFVYAGLFSEPRLRDATNLDGSRLIPPDFTATTEDHQIVSGDRAQREEQLERIDTHSFVWESPDNVALTTAAALAPMRDAVNVLALYPRGDADVEAAARELATLFDGPVHARGPEGAKQYFFTRAVEGSGLREILVPLLLGGLIIFSSLMGSIVDREREIFTYSALGLAPRDVGLLFFAESAVYAVVGGMGGYLFSQVVAKVLSALAARGLFRPPEMNFSSLTAVMTILVVMATVMLSTIYPALKAGRSANPGVARRWTMPAPRGDTQRFVFPFTVSGADLAGILSFVAEHFENHGDATLGNFAAREVRVFRRDGAGGRPSLGIAATVSLAPFDLGIFQRFRMYSQPSEIEGIDEVVVELEKLSGARASWIRGNRVFIDELRNQFLLWRSLPPETVEHYRARTAGALAGATETHGEAG